MNATIGAALIGVGGTFLIWWLNNRKKSQTTASKSQSEWESEGDTGFMKKTMEPPAKSPEVALVERKPTDLSHKQIADTIIAAPPIQRDGIASSFVGLNVVWRGQLLSASPSKFDDTVYVTLTGIDERGSVICYAARRDCNALLVAPEGTKVIVRGTIAEVNQYGAQLRNCTFELPPKPQPPAATELQVRVSELERRMNASPTEQLVERIATATEEFKKHPPPK